MAFENLSDKLNNVFKKLRGKGRLSESDVKEAMREVRLALLFGEQLAVRVKEHCAKERFFHTLCLPLSRIFPCHRHIIPAPAELVKVFSLTGREKRISRGASGKNVP